MDRATADWLADLFPGATVCAMAGLPAQLPIGKPGRMKTHKNNAGRTNSYRVNERMRLLEELALINPDSFSDEPYRVREKMDQKSCDELTISSGDFVKGKTSHFSCADDANDSSDIGSGFSDAFSDEPYRVGGKMDQKSCDELTISSGDFVTGKSNGFLFADKYAKEALLDLGSACSDEFVTQLRGLHSIRTESKEDAGMIAPAVFDPDASEETSRGLDNVRNIRGIWLDNDGGDLSYDEFSKLFPHLRMAIWNTYSHTSAKPRWRVFIPTTLAMSVDIHKMIMRQIESVLNEKGYWTKKQLDERKNIKSRLLHGFDTGKFNAASLFYLPCQAQNPADSFFNDYEGDGRGDLDVERWLEECIRQIEQEPEPEPVVKTEPVDVATTVSAQLLAVRQGIIDQRAWKPEQIIADATSEWRAALPGTGHAAFYKLALALRRAGMDDCNIERTLRDEAWHGRSSKDRRAEIKGIMKTLRRRGVIRGKFAV